MIRFTLKAPACSACLPVITEIAMGTSCTFSILRLEVTTTSDSIFSSPVVITICNGLVGSSIIFISLVLEPAYCTIIVNGNSLESMVNLPLTSEVELVLVPFRTILTPSMGESCSFFTTPSNVL